MVCLEDLHESASMLTTICRHTFHVACLRKWCGAACPVCRFDLSSTLGAEEERGAGETMGGELAVCREIAASEKEERKPAAASFPPTATAGTSAGSFASGGGGGGGAAFASPSAVPSATPPNISPHKNTRGTMCLECRRQKVSLVDAQLSNLKVAGSIDSGVDSLPTTPRKEAALSSRPSPSPSKVTPKAPINPGFWVCLICGTCSCGGFPNPLENLTTPVNHAVDHYASTLHAYALEVSTQKVWDFAGAGFVHRLVSNKSDGKMVEIADPSDTGGGGIRAMSSSEESDGELLWHTKLEGLAAEYNTLLRTELEKQRSVFMAQLATVKKFGKREVKSSLLDALKREEAAIVRKHQGTKARFDKASSELGFVKDLVSSLKDNRKANEQQVERADEELKMVQDMRSETLPALTEKVERLMLKLDGGG
jgi:BRCA1-associated protein